jgi:DNA-binding NarL/FixJ family response regulator
MPVRLVVAEADPLTSEGLACSLADNQVISCVAAPGPDLLERCRQWQPCVLLVADTVFERLDLRRFVEVAEYGRRVQALVVGAVADPCRALAYLRLGCRGYLSRRDSLDTARRAVLAAAAGEMWAGRVVLTQLLDELLDGRASAPRLTGRQREILELIHGGYTDQQITDVLYISGETLRWHLRRLFHTIGARDRATAAEFAQKHHVLGGGQGHQLTPSLVGKNHLAQ